MNTIIHGDCIREMNSLGAGSVDLVFADPPFNIGYVYDVYRDRMASERYLEWSRKWIGAVHRILKADGTFWLAIGDEYAAELKIESQRLGFYCRSWVIWYYTFGVNCTRKFTRSHAHLFHFVKDPDRFVFRAEELENRVPSARQLVYNDNRANPRGRLPDDTWIIRPADAIGEVTADEFIDTAPSDDDHTWTLRPQDLEGCFEAGEDTCYFPRVAGTFKERAGFHGCQMPEQLLGRIIRVSSEPGAIVVDPFSGSGTTAAVAKKLGRQYLAFDLSEQYVRLGRERLASIDVGDDLDGAQEPLMSAPRTIVGRTTRSQRPTEARPRVDRGNEARPFRGVAPSEIVECFAAVHDGHSADRVVADPQLNREFIAACASAGLQGGPCQWNVMLFRVRKAGRLAHLRTTKSTSLDWKHCDEFLFASEIAWRMLLDDHKADSLDQILCDPEIALQFDAIAARIAPGFTPLDYRWAALKLRKQSKIARTRSRALPPARFDRPIPLREFDPSTAIETAGVYMLGDRSGKQLYVGEAMELRRRLECQFATERLAWWNEVTGRRLRMDAKHLVIQVGREGTKAASILSRQTRLIQEYSPLLNLAIGP